MPLTENNFFEVNNENDEHEREQFERFKEEIRKIREEEESGRRSSKHLVPTESYPGVDENELTPEDMKFWNEFKNGTLDLKEFIERKRQILKEANTSRKMFWAFMANAIGPIIETPDGQVIRWSDLTPEQKRKYFK